MQIIPERVSQMIESVNQELRKPSSSPVRQEQVGESNPMRKEGSRQRRKHVKLTPNRERAVEILLRQVPDCGGDIWWTWSGSNRRPLPCHGGQENANYRRNSTYEPAQPAKTAQSALFAAKLLPNFTQRAKGLIVWISPISSSVPHLTLGQSV